MTDLKTEADLRTVYRKPSGGVVKKDIARIDPHIRRFIELSPFLCIGTTSAEGMGDVSPRGGGPGFVHVLDENTLAMPDRPGNNRLDTLSNVVEHPGVGLAFFIPGFEDVLRINGYARLTTEPALMARFAVDEKMPLSVMIVDVKEAYLHCTKAVRRAGLWDPASQVDRESYASAGEIYRDHMALEIDPKVIDKDLDRDARERLY